ncbi:hypothetical protein GFL09_06795 [Pseudomonas stutzeri]|uniref:Uncharacterized protein n=1 Tax=Stutzerimonas stutzeri KOS6 TaxID=1218352 RepID=A0A061JMS0_STUST|nr:hypothetical protein [Stutzerimonas stutzeri]EWC39484.1 hypothetical protein B597_019855 [Stutzerimonas stutzeri KOS6]MBK3867404.1 hypothetical protein [Stutzerimonas stutzeri]
MTKKPNPKWIYYRFVFPDGESVEHIVMPDQSSHCATPAEWTHLGFHQCQNCPLNPSDQMLCPFAAGLEAPLKLLGHRPSFTDVEATVRFRGRTISQTTTLQRALGSLLGAIGATSGCPHTDFLRPMVWFHQPFSDDEETLLRSMSIYLLGQHLRAQRNLSADWSLSGLQDAYKKLRIVNRAMASRLREAAREDSSLNGLVLLDLLASSTINSLERYEGELDEYFSTYTS